MSQSTGVIPANQNGTDYRTLHNAANAAINSSHKGSSRPSYVVAGMVWLDDSAGATAWALKLYDGTDDIILGTFNTTTNVFTASGLSSSAEYLPTTFATNYATTGGSANAYTLTTSPARTVYTTGEVFFAKANFTNTGAATLNVSGLGAKSIKKNISDDLAANDIFNGQTIIVQYDGTNFQLLSGQQLVYWINNLSAITTLEDTDTFPFADASDSSKSKKITLANLRTALGTSKFAFLSDVKSTATEGGTFTSGAWRTRDLTEAFDPNGIVSVSANRFTLAAGSYVIHAECPAHRVNFHKARLYNVTYSGVTDLKGGQPACTDNSAAITTNAVLAGAFVITGTEQFEIQHQCSTTGTSTGFGRAAGFSADEVYTTVQIWKIA